MFKYSEEHIAFLQANRTMVLKELTAAFNETFELSKTPSQIASVKKRKRILTGRTGRFEKGQHTWNKGLKGVCFGGIKTQFKKGSQPANLKPLGHERICKKDGFVLIKVAEDNPYTTAKTRYRFKHHVVWEAVNGPIPKGHVLRFIDGNKLNCDLDNLILVSSAVHLRLNKMGYLDVPEEYRTAAITTAKIEVKVFERIKEGVA